MSNLTQRIISAALLAPSTIAIVWLGGIWFLVFLGLLGAIFIWEWIKMIEGDIASPLTALYVTALLGILIILWQMPALSSNSLAVIATAAGGALLLAQILKKPKLLSSLGVFYLLVPLVLIADLRADETNGVLALLIFLLIVFSGDTGAYFVGRSLGGPKLAPRISVNKTWSGAVGGFVLSLSAPMILVFAFNWPQKLLLWGLIISITAQLGDLLESYFKRINNVKNSGSLLMGHGGFLDRMDGVLIAIVAFYIIFLSFGIEGESAAHFLIKK